MKIIGAIEKVSLPELGITNIDAKIDTGADSSSLHCHILSVDDESVTFQLWEGSTDEMAKEFHFPISRKKRVTSSNGTSSKRVFIETVIAIGNIQRKTRISLSNRNGLRYPILIGKQFLAGLCLVDVSRQNIG